MLTIVSVSQPHSHFSQLLLRHGDQLVSQLLTSSMSWDVGSPPSFRRTNRSQIAYLQGRPKNGATLFYGL